MVDLYAACVSGAIGEDEYLAGLRAAGLVDVEVRDRLVYDAEQLEVIAASDLERFVGGEEERKKVGQVARGLAGKVWSAKFYARKPS